MQVKQEKKREGGLSPLMTKSVYNINEIYLKTRVQQNEIQSPKKREQELVAQKISNVRDVVTNLLVLR